MYLNYLDLHLKSKIFMANLAQYKIPMQKELWCVVPIKNRKKNHFWGKVVISRMIILFNLCILINHSSFQIEVYFILHVYFIFHSPILHLAHNQFYLLIDLSKWQFS